MKKILINAKVYIEAGHFENAIVIKDDTIIYVGTKDEALSFVDKASEIIDCDGMTIVAGFNDSHMHLMEYAESLYLPEIKKATSAEHMVHLCIEYLNCNNIKNGLNGIGWNQDQFVEAKRMPAKADMDKISTDIPIVLERVCGHIAVLNTKALEMMGRASENHDGLVYGDDVIRAKALVPAFDMLEKKEILTSAIKSLPAMGLTSVQSNDVGASIGNNYESYKLFGEIYKKNENLTRYNFQCCFSSLEEFDEFIKRDRHIYKEQFEGKSLTIGPLKLFADGSLGARTALLKNGYKDSMENTGHQWLSDSEMAAFCKMAGENNMQVITHAIGDLAISNTLNCYEKIIKNNNSLRHGLVHCQITDESILKRISRDNILIFAQPIFIDADMDILGDICSDELIKTSYAYGTMLRDNVHLSYGTDCPVESCNPFENLFSAITRRKLAGTSSRIFNGKERVSVESAVDAYTYESAYAEFKENVKGRIKTGQYADLVVLDRDIFTVDEDEIKKTKPMMTLIGGEVVFDAR